MSFESTVGKGEIARFGELAAIFLKFKIVVCKLFHFGRFYHLSFGKGLILYKKISCLNGVYAFDQILF